jgi:hypothetical protein
MVEEVGGTIEWAKGKIGNYPKAKRDLGPLLDALGREFSAHGCLCSRNLLTYFIEPLTQIVGGVGLLLAGVLNLVSQLLKGLGLDGLLKGIYAATGLDKIYKGLGVDKMLGGK